MAHGTDQVLIHGIVMIHIELHHRHNAPECRNEAAEHTCLVHHAQHDVGRLAGGKQFKENRISFRVVENAANESQRFSQELQGVRMDFRAVSAGHRK